MEFNLAQWLLETIPNLAGFAALAIILREQLNKQQETIDKLIEIKTQQSQNVSDRPRSMN